MEKCIKTVTDRKRLENFIERKSLFAAFPFSELSDQELTDTFFDGMVSRVDILCEKLSGAECKIRTLVTENEELQEGMIQQLFDHNEQTIIFKPREQELENERLDLRAHAIEGHLNIEDLQRKLYKIKNDLLPKKKLEHSLIEYAFVELETYADKIVAENSDLKAHVTQRQRSRCSNSPYNTTSSPSRSRS